MRSAQLVAMVVVIAGAALVSGCEAPQEQKDWGSRKGGLNLEPEPGSQREKDEAKAAADAARMQSEAREAKSREFENRSGGLNLAPEQEKKPQNN